MFFSRWRAFIVPRKLLNAPKPISLLKFLSTLLPVPRQGPGGSHGRLETAACGRAEKAARRVASSSYYFCRFFILEKRRTGSGTTAGIVTSFGGSIKGENELYNGKLSRLENSRNVEMTTRKRFDE
jgi:hypothetical protein